MAGGRVGVRPGEDVGLGPLALADVLGTDAMSHPFHAAPEAGTGQSTCRHRAVTPQMRFGGTVLIPARWSLVLLPNPRLRPHGIQ